MTSQEVRGLWIGLIAVSIFALTIPMTRLAVGTADTPQLSSTFIAFGRSVAAAMLSVAYLWATRAAIPGSRDWLPLVVTSAGVVVGFPLLTSLAMRHVEAVHASVIVGVLPLATAVVGAWLNRQRPSIGFWVCAVVGSGLVVAFGLFRSGTGSVTLHWADGLLLIAMACAALGYGYGAVLAQRMRAEHVICWALVIALPLTLPMSILARPVSAVAPSAWWAFAYVSVFSMWLGFFAWYRGLSLGGTVRVSQVQLAQPLLSMAFAVPLLGERVGLVEAVFCAAVVMTVFVGRKMSTGRAPQD